MIRKWSSCFLMVLAFALSSCGFHQGDSHGQTRQDDVVVDVKPTTTPEMLLNAIDLGQFEEAMTYISDGLDINSILPNGRTALIHAVIQGEVFFVRRLIQAGADISIQDEGGQTALEHAILLENLSIWLLLDPEKAKEEQEILFQAVVRKRSRIVNERLEAGVDPNFLHESGETPLTQSVKTRSVPVVRILLNWVDPRGYTSTDRELKNNENKTAWEVAQDENFVPILLEFQNLLEVTP